MLGVRGVSYLSNAILSVMGMAGVAEVRGSPYPRSTSGQRSKPFGSTGRKQEKDWPVHRVLPCLNPSLPGEINCISTATNSADYMWLKLHTGFWIKEHQRASG